MKGGSPEINGQCCLAQGLPVVVSTPQQRVSSRSNKLRVSTGSGENRHPIYTVRPPLLQSTRTVSRRCPRACTQLCQRFNRTARLRPHQQPYNGGRRGCSRTRHSVDSPNGQQKRAVNAVALAIHLNDVDK